MLQENVPLSRSGAQWECGEWELTASELWAVQGGPAQVMGTLHISLGEVPSRCCRLGSEGGICLFRDQAGEMRPQGHGQVSCVPRLPSQPGPQGHVAGPWFTMVPLVLISWTSAWRAVFPL